MLGSRVFRVFVSSTFRDLKAERDALQQRVFPELRTHCATRGYGFQAVDLRWGIREEASSGHRTIRICLSEVERCQEVSPRPNFVVLLGNRYGWRPLPEVIPADEFAAVKAQLAPSDLAAAESAYNRDDNAVPPEYVLKPAREGEAAYDAEALRNALAAAAEQAGLPAAESVRYSLSATEQEIVKGAFDTEHADEHVLCFMRELHGLPDRLATDSAAADYRDFGPDGSLDEEAASDLKRLKSRLRARLGANVFAYDAEWQGAAPSTDHLDHLCEDMLASLRRIIDSEIERLGAYSHLEQERATHGAFADENADGFVGRARYLHAVAGYLDRGANHPLCLQGAGGLGKSALMARAATAAMDEHPGAVVVMRFVGVTPASGDPRTLLQDLCSEIGEAYGFIEPVPTALPDLRRELPKRLQLASPDRPLILFLDSLDQLPGGEAAHLTWLPTDLPAGVRVVASTRPGPALDDLAGRLPADLVIELKRMPASEGAELLDSWLAAGGRTLTPAQRDAVLAGFEGRGSPLYLRLAFEEARLWPSTVEARLGADERSLITQLYERLETEHGPELVGHALGFLACAHERQGLSEEELLEGLAADEETWAEFVAGASWDVPVRQLPVVVWSRLYFDLAAYLSPRASEGASLLSFFHQELAEAARGRYTSDRLPHMHGVLADVMCRLAGGSASREARWRGSAHAIAELPYHQTFAERWDELFGTLTDFTYLEAKAQRVAVMTATGPEGDRAGAHDGVFALLDDYDRALAGADRDGVLQEFRKVLRRESHQLRLRPDLLWQQMYNRLQWTPVAQFITAELGQRSKPSAAPWLHMLSRLRESGALIRTLAGHKGMVHAVAYSPDGTRFVSAAGTAFRMFGSEPEDNTLKIWDAATGAELLTLTGHTAPVEAVAYSRDGTRIISGANDNTIRIWDAATGTELHTLSGHSEWVAAVSYSPDGTQILSASGDGTLKLWDATAGQEIRTLSGHTGPVRTAAYSPDGNLIASGSNDSSIKVWDTASGKELRTISGLANWVMTVAFSPDGSRIASGTQDWNVNLQIWNAATGDQLAVLGGHTSHVGGLAFSPDGTHLASASGDGTLRLWDAASGAHIATLAGHTAIVNAVAYSPDGNRIVSASDDRTLKIWDPAQAAEPGPVTGHSDWVWTLACSPDGTRVVSGSRDSNLIVWDTATGAQLLTLSGHAGPINAVACSPDSTRIVSAGMDGTLKVWDLATGIELLALTGHTDSVPAVAYAPDGARIVSGSNDKTLKVWDAASGAELLTLVGHTDQVTGVMYSPDGGRILSIGNDSRLRVWDARSGAELLAVVGNWPFAVSPDGTRMVSGATVWDAHSGAQLGDLTSGQFAKIDTVAYSPDGSQIATGAEDNLVRVWNAATGLEIATLAGHTDWISAVGYSPDGTLIVSGSWNDRTLRIWDVPGGRCVATFPCLGSIRECGFSPAGTRVYTADTSGTVYILEVLGGSRMHGEPEALSSTSLVSGAGVTRVTPPEPRSPCSAVNAETHSSSVQAAKPPQATAAWVVRRLLRRRQ